MISTGIYVDVGLPISLTLFKLVCPIIFFLGFILLRYRRLEKFNFILLLFVILFLSYAILKSSEVVSLANIALLAFGTIGTYFIYTNINFERRKKIILILLSILFIKSSFEIFLIVLNIEGESFIFPTGGRVDGFVTEPSHYAYIVALLCITYIVSFNTSTNKGLLLLILFMPSLYFAQSAYGYLFLMLSLIAVFTNHLRELKIRQLIPYTTLAGLFIIIFISITYQNELAQRVIDTGVGLLANNDQSMDGNARVRILPFLIFTQMTDTFSTSNLIFGHGLGSSSYFIKETVGVNTDEGHITSFIYDFGLIGILWMFALIGYITSSVTSKLWIRLMFVLMMFNMNIGTQVFWFSIFCFAVIRFEQRRYPDY